MAVNEWQPFSIGGDLNGVGCEEHAGIVLGELGLLVEEEEPVSINNKGQRECTGTHQHTRHAVQRDLVAAQARPHNEHMQPAQPLRNLLSTRLC